MLQGNPDGRALVYSDWPGMEIDVSTEQRDLSKDLGVHLEITPERARLINDTVWEVVAGHPYTAVGR